LVFLRFLLLGFGPRHLEPPVFVASRDVVLVDALGQSDRTSERPVATLEAIEAVLARLVGLFALGRDSHGLVGHLDADLLLRDAGKVERIDDLGRRLPDIERGHPRLRKTPVPFRHSVHQAAQLRLERAELPKRFPTDKSRHERPPVRSTYGRRQYKKLSSRTARP